MSAAVRDTRRWTQIARVRDVRVRRCRAALVEAQQTAEAAHAEVEARRALGERHAAQWPQLLARCGHDSPDAAVWRDALAQHGLHGVQLSAAVAAAEATLAAAQAELHRARVALQREMRAHEQAQTRVRDIASRSRDDG